MTIGEAIRQLDVIKPNAVDRAAKVRWLEEVDFAVYRELVMTHEHGRSLIFNGYNPEDESGADDKLLLAVKPYDRMYVQYLACQIDLQNQEYDLYQNDEVKKIAEVIQAPSAPARPWLTRVASRMPSTIGTGFLKRAASRKASSWVLSPISARATTPVEMNRASMRAL